MIKHFDRYSPVMRRTFALQAFNHCETEINRHFWSFKVASEYSGYIAKRAVPTTNTAEVFKASGPDAGRIPPTVSDWLAARKELENWLRLSALVSAASYFEMYLRQVIRSALWSDPLCRHGAHRHLDGAALLKQSKELPYSFEVEELTRGEWNHRLAAFKRVFGGSPPGLESLVAPLERIRKIRNEVAHGFGRGLDVPPPSSSILPALHSLTHKTFLSHLASLSRSAALVDKYLLHGFIGNFEIVHFYHEWKSRPRGPSDKRYDPVRALQRAINRDLPLTVSTEFCSGLISYYSEL